MSDIADARPPRAKRIKTRPDRRPLDTRPNPEPTVAFGFVLDNQYRIRWAKDFLEVYQKQKACTFTPEECEEKIPSLTFALITTIPSLVYRALPDVPRIRDNLLPVEHPELGFEDFVFALRDNSTTERFHSPLTPETIAAVRKELGLPDGQQPKWVRITVYVPDPPGRLPTH